MSIYAHTVSLLCSFLLAWIFLLLLVWDFGKRTCLVKIIGILVVVLGYYEALFISSRGIKETTGSRTEMDAT